MGGRARLLQHPDLPTKALSIPSQADCRRWRGQFTGHSLAKQYPDGSSLNGVGSRALGVWNQGTLARLAVTCPYCAPALNPSPI